MGYYQSLTSAKRIPWGSPGTDQRSWESFFITPSCCRPALLAFVCSFSVSTVNSVISPISFLAKFWAIFNFFATDTISQRDFCVRFLASCANFCEGINIGRLQNPNISVIDSRTSTTSIAHKQVFLSSDWLQKVYYPPTRKTFLLPASKWSFAPARSRGTSETNLKFHSNLEIFRIGVLNSTWILSLNLKKFWSIFVFFLHTGTDSSQRCFPFKKCLLITKFGKCFFTLAKIFFTSYFFPLLGWLLFSVLLHGCGSPFPNISSR